MRHPTLFVSHGSPMLVLTPHPAREFLEGLASSLPKPEAILVASAHAMAKTPSLTSSARPHTIHDFRGFPPELHAISYPAPGAPGVAARARALLEAAGIAADVDPDAGLDHGTWAPLKLMYPDADLPVTQLATNPRGEARGHFAIGRAIAPLADEGVLIIGSGSLTHNLGAYFDSVDTDPRVTGFAEWVADRVAAHDVSALLDWRASAPYALWNHPTPEHFLPFFVALGAACGPEARRLHHSLDRVLAMDAYAFG